MPDRRDYRAKRVTEEIIRWDACVLCNLWSATPALLALREIGEPYDTICNNCAVAVLDLPKRLQHIPVDRGVVA